MLAGNDVELRCDGRSLAGTVFRPPASGGSRAVLFLHGYGSDRSGYLPRAAATAEALGATTLTFDLGGHGQSDGRRDELSLADHLREVQTAFDFLSSSLAGTADVRRIGLCGASYGGYLAAVLPASRPVWRLLLRAPALYPDADFDKARRDTPEKSSTSTGEFSRLAAAAASFNGRMLIAESAHDDEIPTDVIDHYVRAFPQAHRRILDAGHALATPEQRQQFMSMIVGWFEDE